MTLGVYMAMLSDTLMGFVPGVEGLKVSVGDRGIAALLEEETPDGRGIEFEHGLATRNDFIGYVGAPVTLYVRCENGLAKMQQTIEHSSAGDGRARLEALMKTADTLPDGLGPEDILAVHEGTEVISVNLSAAFAKAMQSLTHEQERTAVYAMVNTLTEGKPASRVEFFFEGEQVSMLAGALEMRGAFVRNPGMVVN